MIEDRPKLLYPDSVLQAYPTATQLVLDVNKDLQAKAEADPDTDMKFPLQACPYVKEVNFKLHDQIWHKFGMTLADLQYSIDEYLIQKNQQVLDMVANLQKNPSVQSASQSSSECDQSIIDEQIGLEED